MTEAKSNAKYTLVLLRHGQSTWNLDNIFTGWVDVDLTAQGVDEAKQAANLLKQGGFTFDVAYSSLLKRAIKTQYIVLEHLDLLWIPEHLSWRLNERMYGALTGLNKSETANKYGDDQVKIWRRSYDIPPPALTPDHPHYPGHDRRYADVPRSEIPLTECLKDTTARFMPLWHETIAPMVRTGKRVLITAHGNSLRALVKHLDNISEDDIVNLNIPTGVPLVYELDENLQPIQHVNAIAPLRGHYLGDPEEVRKAAEAVANQTRR